MARRVADQQRTGSGAESAGRAARPDGRAVDVHEDLLRGILRGLEGRRTRRLNPAAGRRATRGCPSPQIVEVREQAVRLALVFDDPVALASLREQAADTGRSADDRNRAIDALVGRRPAELAPLLLTLVDDAVVCQAALRGLAQYNHPDTVATILAKYDAMDRDTRQQALQTLASRVDWASSVDRCRRVATDQSPRPHRLHRATDPESGQSGTRETACETSGVKCERRRTTVAVKSRSFAAS